MAKEFNRGDPIFIPFSEGKTVTDSQLMPRMYKTREAFQKYFPCGYVKRDSVELAEYNEVVRCKDCRFWHKETVSCEFVTADTNWYAEDFCSYGERRTDE